MIAAHSAPAAIQRSAHSVELGGATDWVQLLPSGTFGARDGRGPYKADAAAVLAATLARAGSAELVIDYDHQSDFGAQPGVGGVAPAAGWIKKMEIRDGSIWGQVEWTQRAAEHLRQREYRYLSPVFEHDKAGNVGRLLRAALTNNPNLELAAVASAQNDGGLSMEFLKQLAKAIGLPETATEAEVSARIAQMAAGETALGQVATAVGKKAGDQPAEIVTAVQAAVAGFDLAAKAVGKTGTDSAADVVTAISAAKAAGAVDPAKYVPIEQVTALQAQVNGLVKRDVEADVDAAVKSGKVAPALRAWATDLRTKDPAAFSAYIAGAPTLVQHGAQLTVVPADVGQGGALTAEEKAVAAQLGLTEEVFLKTKKAG